MHKVSCILLNTRCYPPFCHSDGSKLAFLWFLISLNIALCTHYLLRILQSVNYVSLSFAHFSNGFPFSLLIHSCSCYTLAINPLSNWTAHLPVLSLLFELCLQFLFFLNFILFIFLSSRFLLVINFIHISVYMSIPIAQFITPPPPHPPLSPLGVHMFVLYICVSISALQTGSSVPFF